MRIRSDDGVELAVDVRGSGPSLVLLHGHGGAKEDFYDHVDELARSHTVVTFDHRGHGESDKPTDPAAYGLDRLADDLVAVVDELELGRLRLLGHSMGGMAARRFVLRWPERVEALVFMDTAAGPIRDWDPHVLDLAAAVALEQGKDALKELLDAFSPLNNEAYDRLLAERPGYQEFVDRKWADVSPVAWGALIRAIARQPDDRDALRTVRQPTLVMVGELDESFLEPCRELGELIPGAKTEIIADAGHSPQVENATAWFDSLTSFLGALDASEVVDAV